jgi:hypothetical protein
LTARWDYPALDRRRQAYRRAKVYRLRIKVPAELIGKVTAVAIPDTEKKE